MRVEGDVVPTTDEETAAYFATRPRESRIGAWASHQSQPIADRHALERQQLLLVLCEMKDVGEVIQREFPVLSTAIWAWMDRWLTASGELSARYAESCGVPLATGAIRFGYCMLLVAPDQRRWQPLLMQGKIGRAHV